MKKILPFVFPAIALLIVLFLAYRFYSQRSQDTGEISEFAEGIEIQELTSTEQNEVLRGMGDYETVEMTGSEEAQGSIRYEIVEDRVRFSVMAALPEVEMGMYQVWLKDPASEDVRKAFALNMMKGGYTGSAAISAETLPFDILVTREMVDDGTMEDVILTANISE